MLLAHELHRHGGRGQVDRRRRVLAAGDQLAEPLTLGAVADLIVVLRAHHEAIAAEVLGRRAERLLAEGRQLAGVRKPVGDRARQRRDRAEVGVVEMALPGQRGVQRVVQIVGPLRVAAPRLRALGGWLDHPHVAQVALGDHVQRAAEPARDRVHLVGQLTDQMARRAVEDRVHRVEAQRVDAIILEPHARVLEHVRAHRRRVLAVVGERLAPRRVVARGEIGAELAEVVSLGAEVVVDHVEHHVQPDGVRDVDQAAQPLGAAVRVLRREPVHAVVAPVARTGKRADRQELDRGDAELDQPLELRRRGVERALGRERAHVQLVDHVRVERARDRRVLPGERRVDHLRRPMHAVGLRARRRIRPSPLAVDHVDVARARVHALDERLAIPARGRLEPHPPRVELHLQRRHARRPHAKPRPARLRHRTQDHPDTLGTKRRTG